jgi:hypothetical protein
MFAEHLRYYTLALISQAYQSGRSVPPTHAFQYLSVTVFSQRKGEKSLFGTVHPCQCMHGNGPQLTDNLRNSRCDRLPSMIYYDYSVTLMLVVSHAVSVDLKTLLLATVQVSGQEVAANFDSGWTSSPSVAL